MAHYFSNRAKIVYAVFLFVGASYLFFTENFSIRRQTFEGLELKILASAFIVGGLNLMLEAMFRYDDKSPEHFYRFLSLFSYGCYNLPYCHCCCFQWL